MRPVHSPLSGFSLVEVLVAMTIAAMAATMFSSGFSMISGGVQAARDLDTARRLVSQQVSIFQQYATSNPDGIPSFTRNPQGVTPSWPAGSPGWKTPTRGCLTGQAFPGPGYAPGTWNLRVDPAIGNPFPFLVAPGQYRTSPITNTHLPAAGVAAMAITNQYHIMFTCGGVSPWMGPDYNLLFGAGGQGFTVDVYLANLNTAWTRGGVAINPPGNGVAVGGASEWYVLEVIVYKNGIYMHSAMVIMG